MNRPWQTVRSLTVTASSRRANPKASRNATRSLWLAGALALASLTACENPVDTKPNVLPIAKGDTAEQDISDDASAGSCDCLQPGMWFRFDTLQIKSLDKSATSDGSHPVIGTLNPLWQKDIDRMELNFYFRVKEVSATEVKLEIVNGARVQGTGTGKPDSPPAETCLITETAAEIVAPRDGCKILKSQPAKMNVYAGTPSIPKNCNSGWAIKNVIPLEETYITAEITPDCKAVVNGLVDPAVIPKKALDNTCTCLTLGGTGLAEECGAMDPTYPGNVNDNNACAGCNKVFQSLTSLLNAFGDLQYGCTVADGVGVCLEATFSAKSIDASPAACQ